MNNLAVAYRVAGRADEAIALHEQELEQSRKTFGADHPGTLTSMDNLAAAYLDVGRLDDALRSFEEAIELRKSKLGSGSSRYSEFGKQPGRRLSSCRPDRPRPCACSRRWWRIGVRRSA